MDEFAQKMINSGHSLETARKVAVAGLKGYERKKERSAKPGGPPLHRNAEQSGPTRRIKKLLGKANWFREDGKNTEGDLNSGTGVATEERAVPNSIPENGWKGGRQPHGKPVTRNVTHGKMPNPKKELKVRTVLFVEHTRGGGLAKSLKGVLERIAPILGFKVRVQERGGTKLQDMLSNKNPWKGAKCGRTDCYPCKQVTEKTEDCTARNLLYKS